MNYDKITLKRIFTTRNLAFLSKIKPEYLKFGLARYLLKVVKSYVKKFGTIPTLEVFIAELSKTLPEDKMSVYQGYLEGLMDVEADITDDVLLESLKAQYIMLVADDKIEGLVEALGDKDISSVKQIIAELNSTLNVTEKTPENILDVTYQPSKIRTIRPFIQTMEQRGMRMGGLTIVGAGTGAGKSVFTLNQLMFSYSVDDLDCCLLNLELGADETIARMYCNATGAKFEDVYGNAGLVDTVEEWKQNFFSRKNKFHMRNIRYDVDEIVETIREQASLGITVFGIDYLQLVDSSGNKKEWEALRDLIRDLHELTLELGIVIISPVQINLEEVDEEDNKIKIKVRGSRELENSATLFLFIYQSKEEYENNIARIFTIKARNARKHTYVAETNFENMRFEDTGVVL